MIKRVEVDYHGRPLSIEVGKVAKQADGAALVRYGETVVLVTAVAAREARENIDFFPLTVDYQEKTFAAGKIPGGFFKREGRPSEKEILTCRIIDRSIRPLFADGFKSETQVIATVLSSDRENDPDVLAMLGTSVALEVSNIPFNGPIAGIRVGRIGGQWVMNPTQVELEESDVNIFITGQRDSIVMVEGAVGVLPEDGVLEALFQGHEGIQTLLDLQEEIKGEVGREKRPVLEKKQDSVLVQKVRDLALDKIQQAVKIPDKRQRGGSLADIKSEAVSQALLEFPERGKEIQGALDDIEMEHLRRLIVKDRVRIDGRGLKDIRPITCEVGVLPRTHGSGLFTRGETQALVVATLGTSSDQQKIESLMGESYKRFMLHYNFPPYSVGEVKFLRGPGRREIGHGALAERALTQVLPLEDSFPYTVRIVSEILESNGSTSMATVCGGSLALMDAGVPIKAPVAGIAMGLIKEDGEVRILSDILGDEDHLGDMDFKVAGTRDGVTALQMDIKIGGVTREIMQEALYQAREGRLHILSIMEGTLAKPRADVSSHAPRIITLKVKPEKIREIIGPGGKVIRGIVEQTGVKIDVEDDGTVTIASSDESASKRAVDIVERITAEAIIGKLYKGTVRRVVDFGAFVEIIPGTDGLVHISQLAHERVRRVTDVLKEGDEVMVKVIDIDKQGKVKLSRKDALEDSGQSESSRDSRPRRDDSNRGER